MRKDHVLKVFDSYEKFHGGHEKFLTHLSAHSSADYFRNIFLSDAGGPDGSLVNADWVTG